MDIIYILINEAMPGYVKIGRTTNLEQRIRSLDTTSVPILFERQLHDTFLDQRVRSNREFFEISPERAVSAILLYHYLICEA